MSEGESSEQTGTPWWVKAFITFGLAPAGLAYVIWWQLNVQAVELRETKTSSQHVLQVLERHNVDTGQLIMQMDRQDSLLRLILLEQRQDHGGPQRLLRTLGGHMDLVGLLVAVLVIGLVFWALAQLAGALSIPAPIVTVLQVILVVVFVLYLLRWLGFGDLGPLRLGR